MALWAIRTEAGSIKALHAVLVWLERLGTSEEEAYTSTDGSLTSLLEVGRRRRVAARSARLASTTMMIRPGVPPAPVAVPRRPRPPLQYAYCFMQNLYVCVWFVFLSAVRFGFL